MIKSTIRIIVLLCLLQGMVNAEARAQAVKGQSIRNHTIVLGKKEKKGVEKQGIPMVGFVARLPYDQSSLEVRAAFDFISADKNYKVTYLTPGIIARQSKTLNKYKTLWIHWPDTVSLTQAEPDQKKYAVLRDYLENGGNILLSQQAFHLINILGLETELAKDSIKQCNDEGYGRKLGFHAFRNHPIFDGLNGGAYIQRPQRNLSTRITGYFGSHVPKNGKVVGVDWDYIFLREDTKLIVEYIAGKGKLIAVGAYMNFSEPNLNREHLEWFTRNIFGYLDGRFNGQKEFYWQYSPGLVFPCEKLKPETDRLLVAVPASKPWVIKPDQLGISNRYASKNFWDLAGQRILSMGSETGGIEEVWAHPFMAFRDLEVGIRFSYRDTIYWLSDERPEIEVNPSCIIRQYKFSRGYLREVVVNDPINPTGVVHYEYQGVYNAELFFRFRSNLRWMWPYSEKVTGTICHSWDADLNSFNVRDVSNDLNLFIGANREPAEQQSGQYSDFVFDKAERRFAGETTHDFQAAFLLRYPLAMKDQIDLVYCASADGYDPTREQFEKDLRYPEGVYHRANGMVKELLSNNLVITSPDPNFNKGYLWSLIGTNRFFVNTPGMGKALTAGYSTTKHGWDGGQKINGRPGYGWYFGRDGVWSSFALLDYGGFDNVRFQLEFFEKYQDLTGKIFHEATTSGVIHYDAADATPLYIILAGKYFRHSNDTAYLRKSWPKIKKAIDFCFSTDSDHDHLIENTNIGHGWVEGGELYGSHATIYMAGTWAAALKEAANMAIFIKDPEAESFGIESKEVKKIINRDFWNRGTNFFAYGKNLNGSYRLEPTILPAVPLYFKTVDEGKARECLKQYAGNAFTTNWGSRILRDDSPYFKPTGYHYGSVWPLFTGWSALAEYAYGNYNQGFSHIMNNLNIYKYWGLGLVEEVLNGAEYNPSGVCAHQCWSESMVLQPAIEGILGLEVFAQEKRIVLSPRMPANWDSLTVSNIRISDNRVGLNFYRSGGEYTYSFKQQQGQTVELDFLPVLPAGAIVRKVALDGREIPFTFFKTEQYVTLLVKCMLTGNHRLIIETDKGVSALPLIQEPKPGYPAAGMRIIETKLKGSAYTIILEGVPGTSGTFELYINGQEIKSLEGGVNLGKNGPVVKFEVTFEKGSSRYIEKTVTINLR